MHQPTTLTLATTEMDVVRAITHLYRAAINDSHAFNRRIAGLLLGLVDGQRYPVDLRDVFDTDDRTLGHMMHLLHHLASSRQLMVELLSEDQIEALVERVGRVAA